MHTIVTANWVLLVYCLNAVYNYTLEHEHDILFTLRYNTSSKSSSWLLSTALHHSEGSDCANKGVYVSLHNLHKTCTIYNLAYTKLSLLSQMDV